jgi:hypothetical protein
MLRRSGRLLGRKLSAIIIVQGHPHIVLLHLSIAVVSGIERPENPYGVLEHHSLGIALANPLGFDTIGADGLLLATLDPSFATC